LAKHCERAYVSIRREQALATPYNDLPLVIDDGSARGPGAGLLAAFRKHADGAWLAIGVDMPLLDHTTLADLVRGRDPACVATAYRHPDGAPEPLCAIWEPAARARLESPAGASSSPRRELEKGPTRFIVAADPRRLRSVNTPEDDARVMAELAGG